jgi:hypothetical protein
MLIPESLREAHRTGVRRYLTTGERKLIGKTAELRGFTKGGIEFPLELSLSTWKTREETFFTGMIRDITRRKEAEQAPRATNYRGAAKKRGTGIAYPNGGARFEIACDNDWRASPPSQGENGQDFSERQDRADTEPTQPDKRKRRKIPKGSTGRTGI